MLSESQRIAVARLLLNRDLSVLEIDSLVGDSANMSPVDLRIRLMDTDAFRLAYPDVHFALVARAQMKVIRSLQAHDLTHIRDEMVAIRDAQRVHVEQTGRIADLIDEYIREGKRIDRRMLALEERIEHITSNLSGVVAKVA